MDSGDVAAAVNACNEGRYAESFALINAGLEAKPGDLELLFVRASALFGWGRYREAREGLLALHARGLTGPSFWLKLGWASFWTSDIEESERWMRRAVESRPDDWSTHFGLGTALHSQRKTEESRVSFRRALELDPDNPYCIANLLQTEAELHNVEAAEHLARQAVEVDSGSPVAWSNLGVVLDHQDRYTEAIDAFRRAEELSNRLGGIHYDYVGSAVCLLRAARTGEGIDFLERKLVVAPSVQAHSHYALSLLLTGRMSEGWEQYEFRWIDGPLKESRFAFAVPTWEGQDLAGKTLLLRAEQGYGDFIQFIRYARHLKVLGATVLIHLPEMVRELCRYVDGIDHILAPDAPYPKFDYYANLLSLPRVFGTELDSIPSEVPYIDVNVDLAATWRERLARFDGVKIGLAWAGSPTHLRDRFRSIPLGALSPLAEEGGIQFFSIQKGHAAEQLKSKPGNMGIIDLASDLDDFVDTAAAISELDLIIGVDTSVAHLAGALGKPVWLMLSTPNDWRWLEGREDSPWYPTMRLFRQSEIGDWSGVVTSVMAALRKFVADRVRRKPYGAGTSVSLRQTLRRLPPRDLSTAPNSRLSAATHARVGVLQYWPAQLPVGQSIRYYGEYLQPQLDLLGRMIRPGSTVMEVGSGIGVHAVFLGKLIGTNGHLVMYEPRPLMQSTLRQNLTSNGVTNITILKSAVRRPRESDYDHARLQDNGSRLSSQLVISGETIDALRLDDLDCLKINEHSDPVAVLEGSISTLWARRPILFSSASDIAELVRLSELARTCSYRTWRMEVQLYNPNNFNCRSDNLFGCAGAIALLAVPEEIHMDISLGGCVELQ